MFRHRPTGKTFNGVDINKLTIKFYGKRLLSTESLSIIVVFVENVPKHTAQHALIILSFDCVRSDQREMYEIILFAANNDRISICSTKHPARLLYSKRGDLFLVHIFYFLVIDRKGKQKGGQNAEINTKISKSCISFRDSTLDL